MTATAQSVEPAALAEPAESGPVPPAAGESGPAPAGGALETPTAAGGGAVRSVLAQWPFAAVFAVAVLGVVVMAAGALPHGLALTGVALLLGSVLRFVLPPVRAGLLAVRRRGVDVVTMALLGVVLLLMAMVPLTS